MQLLNLALSYAVTSMLESQTPVFTQNLKLAQGTASVPVLKHKQQSVTHHHRSVQRRCEHILPFTLATEAHAQSVKALEGLNFFLDGGLNQDTDERLCRSSA